MISCLAYPVVAIVIKRFIGIDPIAILRGLSKVSELFNIMSVSLRRDALRGQMSNALQIYAVRQIQNYLWSQSFD